MNTLKKLITAIIITTLISSNLAFAQEIKKDENFFNLIKSYILENYAGDIKEEDLIDGAVKGMFQKLDKHSIYMDAKEAASFTQDIKGKLYGIGSVITLQDGKPVIKEVLDDSPSKKSGLLPGDIITSVNNEALNNITDLEAVVNKIKGDKGTTVTLGINRSGGTISFKLTRDEIKINPVKYKILSGNIGYLKITEFNANVSTSVDKAVAELKKSNIKKLILDLRGNPGGGLTDVVNVAKYFVSGNVVTIKG